MLRVKRGSDETGLCFNKREKRRLQAKMGAGTLVQGGGARDAKYSHDETFWADRKRMGRFTKDRDSDIIINQ